MKILKNPSVLHRDLKVSVVSQQECVKGWGFLSASQGLGLGAGEPPLLVGPPVDGLFLS